MSEFLNTRLGDIHSGEILDLIDELEHARPVGSRNFVTAPLIQFLTQCVYPNGQNNKRVPISTELAAHAPLLETRVGKLPDGDLRDLCAELAIRNKKASEFYSGNKLAVFLTKTLPKFSPIKKPSEKQRRANSVVMQRRANRR